MTKTLLAAIAACAAMGASAQAQSLVAVNTDIGEVLASAETGMTLYTFRRDTADKSNCYDGCAASWPPFEAGRSAKESGAFGIIRREDGSRQWTLNSQPLYFWAGDSERGDATGDGVGGVWDVVRR